MNKISVLVITGKLQHYRVPLLSVVARNNNIKLTVAHSSKRLSDNSLGFTELIVKEKRIGPFTLHPFNLRRLCSNFDVVIATFYLQRLSFMSLLMKPRKYKLAYWGIGVKASQNSRFDSPTPLNRLRYLVANKSDAMIFYTNYARDKFLDQGINPEKLFVMNNTVFVDSKLVKINELKTNLLFIGTLNKSKRIFELLEAYKKINSKTPNLMKLEVIGAGEDFSEVKKWVADNKLQEKIILHGALYNNNEKAEIINRSICAISPNQAGLSVLEVMGYGLPFITHNEAITGGEILNIEHGVNGIKFNSFKDLEDIILDIYNNKQKYRTMGEIAYNFYNNERTVTKFADEMIEVINYLNNKPK